MVRILLALLAVGFCLPRTAPAATIVLNDANTGNHSGWTANTDSGVWITGFTVNAEESTLYLSLRKDFGPPAPGELTTRSVTFQETSVNASTVDRIIVTAESVINNMGLPMTGFRWEIGLTGAMLNAGASSWNTAPLSNQQWAEDGKSLHVGGGAVADGGTFSPQGSLVLDLGLSGLLSMFVLKEVAVPEPAALALLLPAAALLRRRRG